MPRRKPNKSSRKNPKTKESSSMTKESEQPPLETKEQLRQKLHERLRVGQIGRKSRYVRDGRMDKLEEKLDDSKDPKERNRLKKELELLELIEEKETAFSGEYPEYADTGTYGGSTEHDN